MNMLRIRHQFLSLSRSLPKNQYRSRTTYRKLPSPQFYRYTSQVSTEKPKNVFRRVQKFVEDNPYTKFSLSIIAIVVVLSAVSELYKRFKAKKNPAVASYPPTVGHFVIPRNELLIEIDTLVNSLKNQTTEFPVVYMTGEPGTGKSVLAHQYAAFFAENCTKWFGLRSQSPIILYINGSSQETLESSLRECALSLGLTLPSSRTSTVGDLKALSLAIRTKLQETKLPWLFVVDDLCKDAQFAYQSVFLEDQEEAKDEASVLWRDMNGVVLTVMNDKHCEGLPKKNTFNMPSQLPLSQGLELLHQLSGLESDRPGIKELINTLNHNPLAIALCASTIQLYQAFLDAQPEHVGTDVVTTYTELLKQSNESDLVSKVISLYLEAAVTDDRFRHAFDLFGSLDMTHPLPVSIVFRHLESPFYKIPSESLAPPPVDTVIELQKLAGINPNEEMSFFAQLKAMLPFLAKTPSPSDIAAVMAASEDPVSYLRHCPLLSYKPYRRAGFELVQIHRSLCDHLPSLFTKYTVPKLNMDGVAGEEARFNRSTWFRGYQKFDPEKALENFQRSLPGISANGVLTKDKFEKHSTFPSSPISSGTRPSRSVPNYSEYAHLVSHYHRVISSLSEEMKVADSDTCDMLTRKYLYPHVKYLSQFPLLSDDDKALCMYSQSTIEAVLSLKNYDESMKNFELVLALQKEIYGEKNQTIAHTLVDMASLSYSQEKLPEAKKLLLAAIKIYESITSKKATSTFPLEIGVAYSTLALVHSALGEKEQSKDLLEKALAAYQTVTPDGSVSKKQRKLVCSALTDVAHAYMSLGEVVVAKKYIDLAMLANKNMYIESHPEMVRTLNVSSIVYAMMGDKQESQRLRGEAGKQQTQLNTQPLVV